MAVVLFSHTYDAVAFDLRHQNQTCAVLLKSILIFYLLLTLLTKIFTRKQKRFVTALTFLCTICFNSGQGQIRDMETSGLSTSDIPKIRPHEPSCLFLTEGLFSRTVDEKKRINK